VRVFSFKSATHTPTPPTHTHTHPHTTLHKVALQVRSAQEASSLINPITRTYNYDPSYKNSGAGTAHDHTRAWLAPRIAFPCKNSILCAARERESPHLKRPQTASQSRIQEVCRYLHARSPHASGCCHRAPYNSIETSDIDVQAVIKTNPRSTPPPPLPHHKAERAAVLFSCLETATPALCRCFLQEHLARHTHTHTHSLQA